MRTLSNALEKLASVESVTTAGTNFEDYSRRVLDVKVEVDRMLGNMPASAEKEEIEKIMQCHVVARDYWNYCLTHSDEYYRYAPLPMDLSSKLDQFDLREFVDFNIKADNLHWFWDWASRHVASVRNDLQKKR